MSTYQELMPIETTRLAELETIIERGLATFIDVGNALLAIRDARLYRQTHGTFEDYCRERWGMSRIRAHQLIEAAEVSTNLLTMVNTPVNERQIRPLAKLEPEQQREAWQRVIDTAPNGRVTAAHVQAVVDDMTADDGAAEDDGEDEEDEFEDMRICANCAHFQNDSEIGWCSLHQRRVPFGDSILDGWTACNLEDFVNENDPQPEPEEAPRNVHFMSDSIECYTPSEILARAVRAMGAIDLDPCSNSHESPNVPAALHYTQEDDGLAQAWAGRVFMNPPYGRELDDWIAKLCEEYEAGRVSQAIALVPSRTDTQWFRRLRAYPRCFIWGRLRFVNQENSAPFPSMAVYLGENLGAFLTSFSDIGDTYTLENGDNTSVR